MKPQTRWDLKTGVDGKTGDLRDLVCQSVRYAMGETGREMSRMTPRARVSDHKNKEHKKINE